MLKLIRKFRDHFYKNSIFLMLSSVIKIGTRFVFWMIAAKLYSVENVKKLELKIKINTI